ncbi:MAG: DUF2029 domain-containing protein [Anaerolineae bacterium]|nr:DUF2029 domain-containing protein [Anaerolineae bacterium]
MMRQLSTRLAAAFARRPILPLLVVLLLGLVVRVPLLPGPGFSPDLMQHQQWSMCAMEQGWFGMYTCDAAVMTHPPLSVSLVVGSVSAMVTLGGPLQPFDPNLALMIALKLPSLLFELALVALVYWITLRRAGWQWAVGVAALLNFTLGLVEVTAWWGQTDAIYTFFLVLALYLLEQEKPRWAWLIYALAWLAKFQSVVFLPLLFVLTWRRHGWRALLEGGAVFVLVLVLVLAPFVAGSGVRALHPYGGPIDMFPYITNGAYNLWFWLTGSSPTVLLDSPVLVAGLSYFQVGLLLLGLGTALICLRAWLLPERDDLFFLAAAMNMVFFMLPTQIQVRYLYPGLVCLVLALAGHWWRVALYGGIAIAFTYNVHDVVWLGNGLIYYPDRLMFWEPVHDALAMTVFAVVLIGAALRPLWAVRSEWRQRLLRPARQSASSGPH